MIKRVRILKLNEVLSMAVKHRGWYLEKKSDWRKRIPGKKNNFRWRCYMLRLHREGHPSGIAEHRNSTCQLK